MTYLEHVDHGLVSWAQSQVCKNAEHCHYYANPATDKVDSYPNPAPYQTAETLPESSQRCEGITTLMLPDVPLLLLFLLRVGSSFQGRGHDSLRSIISSHSSYSNDHVRLVPPSVPSLRSLVVSKFVLTTHPFKLRRLQRLANLATPLYLG